MSDTNNPNNPNDTSDTIPVKSSTSNGDDFIAEGFHKLDDKLITKTPPKIKWGAGYQRLPDAEKLVYLEKLAATMNHAAFLIQEERDKLNNLCELKEQQIEKLKTAMAQNTSMLQGEITKINEERQNYNKAYAELKRKYENKE